MVSGKRAGSGLAYCNSILWSILWLGLSVAVN